MITKKDALFIQQICGELLSCKPYTPEQRQVFLDLDSALCKAWYDDQEQGKPRRIQDFDAMRIVSDLFGQDRGLQNFYKEVEDSKNIQTVSSPRSHY